MVATAEEMVLELSVVLNAVFASSVLPSRVNEMEASIVVAKGVVTVTLVPNVDERLEVRAEVRDAD